LEVDLYGKAYHSTPAQKERDRKKEYVLKKHYKLKVNRFNIDQIKNRLNWCVGKVHEVTDGPRKSLWQQVGEVISGLYG
jgi:hypothetical protein